MPGINLQIKLVSNIFDNLAWMVKHLPAMQEMQKTRVRSLGQEDPLEKDGNLLQYSCLGNPIDRRAWWTTVHGVAKSQTRLSDFSSLHFIFDN